jgi:GWxTD domain-containing protein
VEMFRKLIKATGMGRYFWSLLIALTSISISQPRIEREKTFGEPVLLELHTLLNGNDSATVYAMYKVRKNVFVLSKPLEQPGAQFSGNGTIAVEILDSLGNSVARNFQELHLTSGSNNIADLEKQYLQGLMSFKLHYGKYSVLLQIEDTDSKRDFPDVRKPLVVSHNASDIISTPIAVHSAEIDSTSFECFNLGGDVLFSSNFNFVLSTTKTKIASVQYSLTRLGIDEDEDPEVIVTDTTVTPSFFPHSSFEITDNSSYIRLSLLPETTTTTVIIPINAVLLKQGRYKITITLDDSMKIMTMFRTRWLDMPRTLTDLDRATLPLQYITTEDQYSDLRKGGRESRIKKFDEFWKLKDPTPATAYNEILAEFYKRADIATTAYRTLKEINGVMTDRGRIFILYGKPTATERILNPGGVPKELWKYVSLKKTFVFEDPSKQGNYKLAETQ